MQIGLAGPPTDPWSGVYAAPIVGARGVMTCRSAGTVSYRLVSAFPSISVVEEFRTYTASRSIDWKIAERRASSIRRSSITSRIVLAAPTTSSTARPSSKTNGTIGCQTPTVFVQDARRWFIRATEVYMYNSNNCVIRRWNCRATIKPTELLVSFAMLIYTAVQCE